MQSKQGLWYVKKLLPLIVYVRLTWHIFFFFFIHKSYATPNINILLQNILEDVQVISGLILNKKVEFWKWFTIQAPLEKHDPIKKWVLKSNLIIKPYHSDANLIKKVCYFAKKNNSEIT